MNANSRALLRLVVRVSAKVAIFCAVVGLMAWPWLVRA